MGISSVVEIARIKNRFTLYIARKLTNYAVFMKINVTAPSGSAAPSPKLLQKTPKLQHLRDIYSEYFAGRPI